MYLRKQIWENILYNAYSLKENTALQKQNNKCVLVLAIMEIIPSMVIRKYYKNIIKVLRFLSNFNAI